MKSNKLIVAIVALLCVSQASALDPKKRVVDYSTAEMMELINSIPSLRKDYDTAVREGRDRVLEYYPERLDYYEDQVHRGTVMGTDYARNFQEHYGNETFSSLKAMGADLHLRAHYW